jgi:FtsH-binding integral membrane protein
VSQYQAYGDESRYLLTAAEAVPSERALFLKRVYTHLLAAVLGCVALTAIFMETPAIQRAIFQLLTIRFGGLILMIGFMAVTWLASSWAHNAPSVGVQYAGLGLSVAAHAVLFTLLLTIAERFAPGITQPAAIITVAIFAVLTAVVWFTGANFNWLSPILWAASLAALAAIVLSIFMGTSLGIWFSAAMIVVASGYILYDTSRIMREYPTTAYVGASLELFTAVAMLFWYVIRLLMQLRDGD